MGKRARSQDEKKAESTQPQEEILVPAGRLGGVMFASGPSLGSVAQDPL